MKSWKNTLLLIAIAFIIILYPKSVKACFSSASFSSSLLNRKNGHQNECRSFGVFEGSGTNDCFSFGGASNGPIVRLSALGGKPCFYSIGHGTSTFTVTVAARCMCNNIAVSRNITITLTEWGLSSLSVEGYNISPKFHNSVKEYSLSVPNNINSINIKASGNDASSTITGTGTVSLNVGSNIFKIRVKTPQNISTDYTLTVTRQEPKGVTGITLDKTYLEMNVNDKVQLVANVLPTDSGNKKVIWSSSNTNVLTVNQNGLITGINSGNANVTARTEEGGFTASASVKVIKPIIINPKINVVSINFIEKNIKLDVDSTKKLEYRILPTDATNQGVSFSSSNEEIVIVDSNGNIKPKKVGVVTVSVKTLDGNHTSDCLVTVTNEVDSITANIQSMTLNVGESQKIIVTLLPFDASDKTVYWSSKPENVVSITKDGIIKALKDGETIVTATTKDGKHRVGIFVNVIGPSNQESNFGAIILVITCSLLILALSFYFYKNYIQKKE